MQINPYVHNLDKRVRTHGPFSAPTEYRVRTHWYNQYEFQYCS